MSTPPIIKPLPPARFVSSVGGASLGILLILFGCCSNVLTLEILTRRDSSLGNLITFAQFLFISCEGFLHQFNFSSFSLKPRQLPLLVYVKLTSIFFLTSVLNNKALDFDISIPVHTVFRSSGLTATLLLGNIFYSMKYSIHQIIACLLVTSGIIVVTLADAFKNKLKDCCHDDISFTNSSIINNTSIDNSSSSLLSSSLSLNDSLISFNWLIGIFMLFTALFLSAFLGHEQDRTYKKYGKNTWKEMMFYSHLFALPAFSLAGRDIFNHFHSLFDAEPVIFHLYEMKISLPFAIILLLNLILQAICIRGVYLLTTHTNTLTCNLIITARKLISLLLSVRYFGNIFTGSHWIGSLLVFLGVLTYSFKPSTQIVQVSQSTKNDQEDKSQHSSTSINNGKHSDRTNSNEPLLADSSEFDDQKDLMGIRHRSLQSTKPMSSR